MKKKVLMKRILTALAMAAMIPAGETWAATYDENTDTLILGSGDSRVWGLGTHDLPFYTYSYYKDGNWWPITATKYVYEFKNVQVSGGITLESVYNGRHGLIEYTKGHMPNTDLEITVPEGSGENSDALQVTGDDNDFQVKDFTAHVSAPNSDALHISDGKNNNIQMNNFSADVHGADSDAISIDNTATNGTVTIHGTLDATVANGNGIRANASFEEGTNKIIVQGETNITLEGGQVEHTENIDGFQVTAAYNPAAVYAGNDSTTSHIQFTDNMGWKSYDLSLGRKEEASGRGQVDLNGDATIQIGNDNYGLYAGKNGQINVNKNLTLTATGDNAVGIAAENSTLIYKDKIDEVTGGPFGEYSNTNLDISIPDASKNNFGSSVILNGDANVINVGTNNKAIYAEGVDANGISNTVKSGDSGIGSFAITGNVAAENGGNITLEAIKENSLTDNDGNLIGNRGSLTGNILASGQNGENKSTVALHAKDSFSMTGDAEAKDGGTVTLTAGENKDNYVSLTGNLTADGTASSASLSGYDVAMQGDAENTVTASATNGGTVSLTAANDVSLTGNLTAAGAGSSASLSGYHVVMEGNAAATDGGKVKLTAGKNAGSYVRLTGDLTADGTASSASLEGDTFEMIGDASAADSGNVTLDSNNYGGLYGALTASGSSTASMKSEGLNYILSQSVIDNAGGLGESAKIISALYAENGGEIDLTGSFNYIAADYSGESSENYSRRAVWAYDKADISITGGVQIEADYSVQDDSTGKNSTNMAIVAGTATDVTSGNVNAEISDRATVTVKYDSESAIKGDIVAAYAGKVDITPKNSNAKINITGNLLAGNNGILNVNLGSSGTLTGRADDYGDAGAIDGSQHTTFFDPAFSSDIYKGGAVNLTMGAGSRWNVTGQSWITSITTADSGSTPVIDLVSANTDRKATAHALTVYNMDGNAVFNMSLDGDRDASDMLYMKKANGSYIINVVDAVTTDAMRHDKTNTSINFDGLRFATVGKDSDVSFRAVTLGAGMRNIEYTVESEKYDSSKADENNAYNSADGKVAGSSEKPGSEMVEGFFGSEGTPPTDSGEESANGQIMLLAEGDEAAGTSTATTETTNFKLTGIKGTELSDAGKTVVNMSKVNYSNAVYMDRLNKRMGEARYLDGDDGLWVRLRHDRIGKDNAFRSMNTMMELGYDRKVQSQKDGEHRRGVAFDYMRGTADYTNVMGSGDVRRAGVWLYDTWLGDKGHYTDYVVKYGHLSNDFDVFSEMGEEINGDYSNNVWSASAEYGRKKDIGNDWYFEPQAQMQYAYVTSADYTTSQGTKVELDGIDSLIGRAGFRLGRDTSEGNTVYFKADILHEFLGDQDIHAMDTTTNGVLTTTYENEGTWYDVGFGFSHRMGKDSYMFLDLEHSFGNDNDETYQINIGLSKAF